MWRCSAGRPCGGERRGEEETRATLLPSPEETAASGTPPESSDGATSPQTPAETNRNEAHKRTSSEVPTKTEPSVVSLVHSIRQWQQQHGDTVDNGAASQLQGAWTDPVNVLYVSMLVSSGFSFGLPKQFVGALGMVLKVWSDESGIFTCRRVSDLQIS